MHARQIMPAGLVELARLQEGVLTREQVLASWSRRSMDRAVAEGHWQRIVPGAFFTSPLALPWLSRAWAGVLIGGDDARIGGLAAAYLHKLHDDEPIEIDVLVPFTRGCPAAVGSWRFHRERPGARRARTVGSPPRLAPEDTVLDLAADPDPEVVVRWLTAAVQSRRTTAARLRRAVDERHFVPHRALITEVLAEVGEGVRSNLERAYLRDVERAHGLPTAERQVGRAGTQADVWYRDYGLLVELDGHKGHEGEGEFRDMNRDNRAVIEGLTTLRYGDRNVRGRPCEVARQVAGVLSLRGWPGPLKSCSRCRLLPR